MQDIISTLKNALLQAEAGLEVAVGRLTKDGTERGDFKPSEVLALASVREALAMPVPLCLHQIQEPAPVLAAPEAVAVPNERAAFEVWWRQEQLKTFPKDYELSRLKDWGADFEPHAWDGWQARAALAATPVAAIGNPISKQNQQVAEPMVLPEPVATIYTMEALAPGGAVKYHAQVHKTLPSGTKLLSEPDVHTVLAQAATAAAPQAQADARDAELYRHIFDNKKALAVCVWGDTASRWLPCVSKAAADQAIAAIAAAKGE